MNELYSNLLALLKETSDVLLDVYYEADLTPEGLLGVTFSIYDCKDCSHLFRESVNAQDQMSSYFSVVIEC